MFKSLIYGFATILRKPLWLLPALIVTLVNLTGFYFALPSLMAFLIDGLVLGGIPRGELFEVPILLLLKFKAEIATLLVLLFLSLLTQVWLYFVYSRLVKDGKAGLKEAFGYAFENKGKILGLAGFFYVVGFLYLFFLAIFAYLSLVFATVGMVLVLLWLLIGLYLGIKLVFYPIAVAYDETKPKKVLEKIWHFTAKHFLMIVLLLLVLSFIYSAIVSVGDGLSDFVPDEMLSVALFGIFVLIASMYVTIVPISFYAEYGAK